MTFRAQLSSTADADSTTLLRLIEGWVSTGPIIRVSGVLRTVDKDCPVAISDFSEGECVIPPTETPSQTTDEMTTANPASSQSDNTAAIVGGSLGGILALLVLFIVTAAIVVVVVLVMRSRRGKFSLNKAEE